MTAVLHSELTTKRLRVWGVRSGQSIIDQGVSSGAGFILNLCLARWLDSEAYGGFAVAFTTLLFLFGFHGALLLEPMSVIGPSEYTDNITRYFVAQVKLHCIVTLVLSVILLLTAAIVAATGLPFSLVSSLAGSGFALPFLLLLWMVRRMCYVVRRPSLALLGSIGYLFFITLGLVILRAGGLLGPFSAFLLMGAASIPPALYVLKELGVISAIRDHLSLMQVLRENWNYGRWLCASSLLFSLASQVQTYIAAGLMGLGAAGILRALQIPSLVMTQVVTAVGLLTLPSLSAEFGVNRIGMLRKKAVLTTAFLGVSASVNAALLWVAAKPIEHLLYGGKFASYAWLIPVLALAPALTGFAMGFTMALRAIRKPHYELLAYGLSSPVGLILAIIFIKLWGLGGAALSLLCGLTVYALVLFWSFTSWTRKVEAPSLLSDLEGESRRGGRGASPVAVSNTVETVMDRQAM